MSSFPKIAIIDYQMSNLFSVKHACDAVGLNSEITSDPQVVLHAEGAILPGVGAFGDAMKNLRRLKLIAAIQNFTKSGRKFMGVCLGMQLLFSKSEEFGLHAGLSILPGKVVKFNKDNHNIKVPQIGWNKIYHPKNKKNAWTKTPLSEIKNNDDFYFVHSFFVVPDHAPDILAMTNYEGVEYCSVISYNNIFAVQFHPEKSGLVGLKIYRNWGN